MNDLDMVEYWESKYKDEKQAKEGTESYNLQKQMGYILAQIIKYQIQYNKLLQQQIEVVWFWWFNSKLARRVLKKFKVKTLHNSKKASEYWKKYYAIKHCKIVSKNFIKNDNLSELIGLLSELRWKDEENKDKWNHVILKLYEFNKEKEKINE